MKYARVLLTTVLLLLLVSVAVAQDNIDEYCIVTIEPIREGETHSRVTPPRCFDTVAEAVEFATDGRVQLPATASLVDYESALIQPQANWLIATFWDNTNYNNKLVSYLASEPCSASASFGQQSLGSYNDRFESGQANSCNYIQVYENTNYGGASLTCSSCSSFGILNNQVSSWKAYD